MTWTLVKDGDATVVHQPDARELRDLLHDDELEELERGALVAEVDGVVIEPGSPLPPDGHILLRAPEIERDLSAFLYRVNQAGDRVRIDELIAIRRFEESRGVRVWDWDLERIRAEVVGGFFAGPAALTNAVAGLHVARRAADSRRRRLPRFRAA